MQARKAFPRWGLDCTSKAALESLQPMPLRGGNVVIGVRVSNPDAWCGLHPPLVRISRHASFDTRPMLAGMIKRLNRPAVYAQQPFFPWSKILPHAAPLARSNFSLTSPLSRPSLFPGQDTEVEPCPREPPRIRERLQSSGVILLRQEQHAPTISSMESSDQLGGWRCCKCGKMLAHLGH